MKNLEYLQKNEDNRIYQNKMKVADQAGKKVEKDAVIYKDLMVFKELVQGNYFGGRSLLAIRHNRNVNALKRARAMEKGLSMKSSITSNPNDVSGEEEVNRDSLYTK